MRTNLNSLNVVPNNKIYVIGNGVVVSDCVCVSATCANVTNKSWVNMHGKKIIQVVNPVNNI